MAVGCVAAGPWWGISCATSATWAGAGLRCLVPHDPIIHHTRHHACLWERGLLLACWLWLRSSSFRLDARAQAVRCHSLMRRMFAHPPRLHVCFHFAMFEESRQLGAGRRCQPLLLPGAAAPAWTCRNARTRLALPICRWCQSAKSDASYLSDASYAMPRVPCRLDQTVPTSDDNRAV